MTVPNLLHLVRGTVHASPDDYAAFLQVDESLAGTVKEALARGMIRTRRAFYADAPEHSAVRLTDTGLRWCRNHPKPKRRIRVRRERP